MSQTRADRNLVFGIVAWQMDFIRDDALASALEAWSADKSRDLGQILEERNLLSAEDLAMLLPLAQRQLEKHDDDPARCLAAMKLNSGLRKRLERLEDPEVQAGLERIPPSDDSAHIRDRDRRVGTNPPKVNFAAYSMRYRLSRLFAKEPGSPSPSSAAGVSAASSSTSVGPYVFPSAPAPIPSAWQTPGLTPASARLVAAPTAPALSSFDRDRDRDRLRATDNGSREDQEQEASVRLDADTVAVAATDAALENEALAPIPMPTGRGLDLQPEPDSVFESDPEGDLSLPSPIPIPDSAVEANLANELAARAQQARELELETEVKNEPVTVEDPTPQDVEPPRDEAPRSSSPEIAPRPYSIFESASDLELNVPVRKPWGERSLHSESEEEEEPVAAESAVSRDDASANGRSSAEPAAGVSAANADSAGVDGPEPMTVETVPSRLDEAIAQFHSPAQPTRANRQRLRELRSLAARFRDEVVEPVAELAAAQQAAAGSGDGRGDGGDDDRPERISDSVLASDRALWEKMGIAPDDPAYLSPEQFAGRLDQYGPATDVYRLGAALYLTLAGHPPCGSDWRSAGVEEIRRRVFDSEFAQPSKLVPGVPLTLEAICLKALSREPSERQPNPRSLSDDLRQWLSTQKALALVGDPDDKPSLLKRGVRGLKTAGAATRRAAVPVAARAREWGLGANLLTAVLVLLGFAVLFGIYRQSRAVAQVQRDREESRARLSLARKSLDDIAAETLANPAFNRPELKPVRDRILGSVRGFYQDLAARSEADPDAASPDLNAIRERVADLNQDVGSPQNTLSQVDQSVDSLVKLVSSEPDNPAHLRRLAMAYEKRAAIGEESQEPALALEAHGQAVDAWRKLAQTQNDSAAKRGWADALLRFGGFLRQSGKAEEAEKTLQQARGVVNELVSLEPKAQEDQIRLAKLETETAQLQSAAGQPKAAEESLAKALKLQETLGANDPESARHVLAIAKSQAEVARAQESRNDLAGAEAGYRSALSALERLTKNTNDPSAALEQAEMELRLARLFRNSNRAVEADRLLGSAAQRLAVPQAGAAQSERRQELLGRAHLALGETRLSEGKTIEAVDSFSKARDLLGSLTQSRPQSLDYRVLKASADHRLGRIALSNGQIANADQGLTNALAVYEQAAQERTDSLPIQEALADVHSDLGDLRISALRWPEGVEHKKKALTINEALGQRPEASSEGQRRIASARVDLARAMFDSGDAQKAEALASQALATLSELAKASPIGSNPNLEVAKTQAMAHYALGLARQRLNQPGPAEESFRQAQDLLDQLTALEPNQTDLKRDLAAVSASYGVLLRTSKRFEDAQKQLERALNIQIELTRSRPDRFNYALDLGRMQKNLASIYYSINPQNATYVKFAKKFYDDAVGTLQRIWDRHQDHPAVKAELTQVFRGRAWILNSLDEYEAAMNDWNQALTLDDGRLHNVLVLTRGFTKTRLNQLDDAIRDVEAVLNGQGELRGEDFHNAAWVHCEAGALIVRDPKRSPADRAKLSDQWNTRAVELFAKAFEAGYYKDAYHRSQLDYITNPNNFRDFNNREDFKKLLSQINQAKPAP